MVKEVKAAHILVKGEPKAKEIMEKLERGRPGLVHERENGERIRERRLHRRKRSTLRPH
jgi:hypothetical protein